MTPGRQGKGPYTDAHADDSLELALSVNRIAYESLAEVYESTGAERASRAIWLLPLFKHVDDFDPPVSLLDVGAADGHLARSLAERGYRVSAIDFAPSMAAAIGRNAPGVTVICDEFLAHSFEGASFDIVLLVAFVHLFPPPWDHIVLRKAASLLSSRGVCFVSTTVESGVSGFQAKSGMGHQPNRYRNRYTSESFSALIESAGLAIRTLEYVRDPVDPSKVWMDCICVPDSHAPDNVLDLIQNQT